MGSMNTRMRKINSRKVVQVRRHRQQRKSVAYRGVGLGTTKLRLAVCSEHYIGGASNKKSYVLGIQIKAWSRLRIQIKKLAPNMNQN